jgi:tRNA ligase
LGIRPISHRFFPKTAWLNFNPERRITTMAPPQHSAEDSQLIADLHKLSQKARKLVRSSAYPAPADPGTMVRSWKMNEFKYYDVPCPFPTLARGLFTTELPIARDGSAEQADTAKYRIVARGYDKFFNIGEVPWTTVRFDTIPVEDAH